MTPECSKGDSAADKIAMLVSGMEPREQFTGVKRTGRRVRTCSQLDERYPPDPPVEGLIERDLVAAQDTATIKPDSDAGSRIRASMRVQVMCHLTRQNRSPLGHVHHGVPVASVSESPMLIPLAPALASGRPGAISQP